MKSLRSATAWTVLRNGRKIGTRPTSETNKRKLANWMVGRDIEFITGNGKAELGDVRLRLDNISCGSDRGNDGIAGCQP